MHRARVCAEAGCLLGRDVGTCPHVLIDPCSATCLQALGTVRVWSRKGPPQVCGGHPAGTGRPGGRGWLVRAPQEGPGRVTAQIADKEGRTKATAVELEGKVGTESLLCK